jgi:hypothetical protein
MADASENAKKPEIGYSCFDGEDLLQSIAAHNRGVVGGTTRRGPGLAFR